jgi:energy-coupling factor transporter transmembrane protein EcfT
VADLVVFRYLNRDSTLHRLDGRFKIACLVLFSVAASLANTPARFAILTLVLFAALIWSQLPIASLVKELWYFSLIIVPGPVVQSFSIPGATILDLPFGTMSLEGLQSGLFFGWRLVVVIMLCVVITGTTPLSLLSKAVEWYLRPIPFVPAARIAMMMNLTFVFVPLVFDQAAEMSAAQQARCVGARRNPIKRMTFIALPLLVQTFRRADEMALAMESRCYSEEHTKAMFTTTINDWLVLFAAGLVFVAVLLFPL